MACCSRLAPALLVHLNLLLAMCAGAGLATAARLKWDPSTYVALRQLFPLEYRVAAVVLCAAAVALLALAHLAALALAAGTRPATRRYLMITYAVLMTVLVCGEAAWLAWSSARVAAWLRSEQAAQMLELLELREHLQPILALLARWHPLPDHIRELIEEAQEDAPRNLYVGGSALLLAALLQPGAALLALLCAASARRRAAGAALQPADSDSYLSTDNEKAPLKTAFRNGRLVIL